MKSFFTLSIFLLISLFSFSQDDKHLQNFNDSRGLNTIRFAFYNVENLFDTIDDPLKRDDEFTPEGERNWNYQRYRSKIRKIYKNIMAIGGWNPPEIMGLCELENRFVLDQIVNTTPLKQFDYKIIHYESPDMRGIDVGFIYRKNKFTPIYSKPIRVVFKEENSRPTRDILYIKGLLFNQKDTIHIFINHWPSRYGGHLQTETYRIQAAQILRKKVDSIIEKEPKANILISGDFNDYPNDISITEHLKATDNPNSADTLLYNATAPMQFKKGTHKFQGEWGILDQIIISHNLKNGSNNLKMSPAGPQVFDAPWLLTKENIQLGETTHRTYQGPAYKGGFSDHLPIYLDISRVSK